MRQALNLLAAAAISLSAVLQADAENVIEWQTLGNQTDTAGKPVYIQRFTVTADSAFDGIAVCQFKRGVESVNPLDTISEILPGYFRVSSPRFASAAAGEPVVVDIRTRGALKNISYKPDGMHLISCGRSLPARNVIHSTIQYPAQWQLTSGQHPDGMIYGEQAFAVNDSLRSQLRPAAYAQLPTPKSISLKGGMIPVPDDIRVVTVKDKRHDYWRADITPKGTTLYTNSRRPEAVKAQLLRRISSSATDGQVPVGRIESWADYPYRGMMLDVARNFTGKDDMKQLIGLLARYGINILHLHLGDDEGWRLEMPSLPELTTAGSRRGYTLTDDAGFLKGIYSGDGNPDSGAPANGHYSVADYIELLQFADSLGMLVIPEFDTPGHSRAAIQAMEARRRNTGDAAYRLIEDGDSSVYTSAQAFHDNVMNPALDGPYRFWDTVFGDLIDIYDRAGVPLPAVHVGGDEVARNAWSGSPAARRLMAELGLDDERQLHAHFVKRVGEIAAQRGLKILGWQEIARDHGAEYDAAVQPVVYGINCWTNAGRFVPEMAAKSYPVILSNVDYLYFDQTPTTHPEEPGLVWGGIVDEFRPLHATVDELCPASPSAQTSVIGVSGTLFAETVRSRAMIERYLLPRLLGLSERAHNAHATVSDAEYFGALTAEMEQWAAEGRDFYLRQPGIRLVDGLVEMNEPYGLGVIRYTLDGSQPTADSPAYDGPFNPGATPQVRARLFYGPAESVTSILYILDR